MHWFDMTALVGLWYGASKGCDERTMSIHVSWKNVSISAPQDHFLARKWRQSQNQESVPTRHIYETKDMSGASVATLEYAVSCVRDGLNSRSNFPWRTDNVNIPCFEFVSSESLAKNYHRVLGKELAMTRKLVIIISFLARWTIGRYGHYCPD